MNAGGRIGEAARLVARVVRCFGERDLLSYASAIAFQVLFAVVPLTLAAIAVLGFLGLQPVWDEELAPRVREGLSPEAFAVVDDTVQDILGSKQELWLTFGLAFAVWQVASAIRATMTPLNVVYGEGEERSLPRRIAVSVLVALAAMPLFVLALIGMAVGGDAVAAFELGPFAAVAVLVARWGITALLLFLVITLVLRFAPTRDPHLRWVSLGSAVVIGGWVLATLGYLAYLQNFASYASVYGALASVIVLMTYVYLLALVFLAGVQTDALLRQRLR